MIYVLFFLLFIALISGLKNMGAFRCNIYIKNFSSPYFEFGLSYKQHILKSGIEVGILTIGLYFFTFTFEFFKL